MRKDRIISVHVEKSVWNNKDLSREIFKELQNKTTKPYVLKVSNDTSRFYNIFFIGIIIALCIKILRRN
jgi:hypothetical protein